MDAPTIFTNNDVLIRVMEFLGPRHVCIGIGATSKQLSQLSKCNSLWRLFWRDRCHYNLDVDEEESSAESNNNVDADVHKAAMVFRHAIHEMGLADKIYSICTSSSTVHTDTESSADENVLYMAYIQKHSAMKLTNLRVEPFGRSHQPNTNHQKLEQSNLSSPLCTQAWPGQLSLVVNDMIGGVRNTITCLNPAESWCDHPSCTQARCGPQGCLRCYRFLPRDYALSAGGQLAPRTECSERSYDYYTFVKCSWCSVSFCNEHVDRYYEKTTQDSSKVVARRSWYKCDECQLQSCPDCVSQIFLSPPDMDGCNVVTAGKPCRKNVCNNCIWYVGKEKQSVIQNIPGGIYPTSGSCDILTIKGENTVREKGLKWQEVETCCSKCVRHVEFRLKELEQVRESFGGLIP